MGLSDLIAAELTAVRSRSLGLTDPLSDDDLSRQHSPLMSPLVWDLAHVGNYEDQWLLRAVDHGNRGRPDLDDLYDAFRHARADRPTLPILPPREARRYIAQVRNQVLDVLDASSLDGDKPLLRDGFVYGMVIQHEHQHDETMLATRQLMGERAVALPSAERRPAGGAIDNDEVFVGGGTLTMGTDLEPWAYDNERPAHPVEVAPFWIDTTPVTCGAYADFVEDGGTPPMFWEPDGGGGWTVLRFGERRQLDPQEPVQHVSWQEADAFARWAGKRLPTEAEWEMAASQGPDGRKRRYPWGDDPPNAEHTNLGQRHDGPVPVGSYPAGVSPWGCHQMIGDVWEWTASDFTGYPGFTSFPYREYSEVFFGNEYKVLRGGSWATHPLAIRTTFRNWDFPIRRQIFAGFRCARSA